MNEAFDKLTQSLDSLYGLPGAMLTLLFCWGIGYLWRMIDVWPNKYIPVVSVVWGMIWNVLLRPPPAADVNATQHYCRLVAVGFLIGIVACVAHGKVIKPLEDKFPWLKGLLTPSTGKTEIFTKPPIQPK